MDIALVSKLTPKQQFVYWVKERTKVAQKRRAGQKPPWTDDAILNSVFFTNAFREDDKTTVWFRKNYRDPNRDSNGVIFGTTAFRWFNYIPTGEILLNTGLLDNWDEKKAVRRLKQVADQGGKVFTGAFIINSPARLNKLECICNRVTAVWDKRKELIEAASHEQQTLESFTKLLTQFPGMGGFMSYEVVCDLRYTWVLENAPDILTWAHVGPGATRGLCRMFDIPFIKGKNNYIPPRVPDDQEKLQELMQLLKKKIPSEAHRIDMRTVEHSLCEWDKYMRSLLQDGRVKRKYTPGKS